MIIWGILFVAVLALAAWGLVSVVRNARRQADPLHSFVDPETGSSEEEWMTNIR